VRRLVAVVCLAPAAALAQDADLRCVPAGVLHRGRAQTHRPDERPPHRVSVGAFCMDATLVTRAAFARFVSVTGYVTDAERAGYGVVSYEGFDDWAWQHLPHGSWRAPSGVANDDTRSFLRDDAPVVMTSWNDAVAYCAWRRGRLPTEAEWEYAMRAGGYGTRFPWGDAPLDASGHPRLNYWQGRSHARNDRLDGWVYVSPVRAFAPNAWGFYDPAGNVWQWTSDLYRREAYADTALGNVSRPDAGGASQRVVRGGSWWCAEGTCEGFGLWYRGHNDPASAFSNLGFRCAYDARGG
jgi:formylglycine-generating enzyme